MASALEGVRVVEYAQMVSGPYCGKLLADHGAEVVKIEPPGTGDAARRRGPFYKGYAGPEASALFLYLNTSKRSITLDLNQEEGRRLFRALAKDADILVEDSPAGTLGRMGLGYEALSALNPHLIVTSITPFGQTGPYRDYKAHHLNLYHASGQGYLLPNNSPDLSREPIKIGGLAGDYACGLHAAVAALGALYWQRATGQGQRVDLSKQEALLGLQRANLTRFPNKEPIPTRLAAPNSSMGGLMECRDGHVVMLIIEDHQWTAFCQLVGRPDWAADPRFTDRDARGRHFKAIEPEVRAWMMARTRQEIYHAGQALSCPVAPVLRADEVLADSQLNFRDFFVEVAHPATGPVRYPGAPFKLSETPWRVGRPAPLLGQDNDEIYARLGLGPTERARLAEQGVI
ncbi:MAG: CoA transferase [Chloroflexi bacterium]|nr:CoA transferase [Chloroflexota bacterium]